MMFTTNPPFYNVWCLDPCFMTKDGILNLQLSSVQIWYFSFVAIGVLHLLIWYAVFPDQSWPGSWVLQRP